MPDKKHPSHTALQCLEPSLDIEVKASPGGFSLFPNNII